VEAVVIGGLRLGDKRLLASLVCALAFEKPLGNLLSILAHSVTLFDKPSNNITRKGERVI
jgi:hypothetical protein